MPKTRKIMQDTHRQETIGVDHVIERMMRLGVSDGLIVETVNRVFLTARIDETDVQRRRQAIESYAIRLQRLIDAPRIEQRTPEWYAIRRELVTASDFAQALGDAKFGTQRQFFIKKCGYVEEAFNASMPPLKWGIMFEPVAADLYVQRNGGVLHDFGLLRHPTLPFIGASPDGITDHGIMVEIKCPYRRKVTGQVPLQYYYQIQGQLEVCGLDECDYLECEFAEYDELDEFECDDRGHDSGVIVEFRAEDGTYSFEYGDGTARTAAARAAALRWARDRPGRSGCQTYVHAWRLDVLNIIRVRRDQRFIDDKLPQLEAVWNTVLEFRKDRAAYDEYMGRGRKKNAAEPAPPAAASRCMFVDEEDADGPSKARPENPARPPAAASRCMFVDEEDADGSSKARPENPARPPTVASRCMFVDEEDVIVA